MLYVKYTGTFYSHLSFCSKGIVLTKIMFSNCVVTICYFIDLFHIYLQTSNIIFSPFKGSLTILKRKRNTLFQNIKIQLIKSAHDIAKSGKINITQNICLVLSSNINLSLFKTMFVAYINF